LHITPNQASSSEGTHATSEPSTLHHGLRLVHKRILKKCVGFMISKLYVTSIQLQLFYKVL
jgi:hypothetical protein